MDMHNTYLLYDDYYGPSKVPAEELYQEFKRRLLTELREEEKGCPECKQPWRECICPIK